MERQRVRDRFKHMLSAISAIERLTTDTTLSAYSADADRVAAVERYFEKLSEASRHLPAMLTARHPEIPWRSVADLGNVLRHAYDQVSDQRLWLVITDDLPVLKVAVIELLKHVEGKTSS
ncbi:MAG: HepT-like ribonuclease domain-containing protein [Defluviicoccus sp.]